MSTRPSHVAPVQLGCQALHQPRLEDMQPSHTGQADTLALRSRAGSGAHSLQTNFESTLHSGFYANLYRLSGLQGGHVIMLGADFASR